MPSFQSIFLAAVILSSGLRLWLLLRQMRHVWRHRDTPPDAFLGIIPIEEHRKAAAYTLAKARLGLLHLVLETGLLLVFTLGGGLQWLHDLLAAHLSSPLLVGTALLLGLGLISAAAELPLSALAQFRVEARFGFNRQTPAGFVADLAKQTLLGLLIGGPLLLLVLWLMGVMGESWWLWVWGVWMAFNLLILAVYPTFIAPLFNKFTPLEDQGLRERIEQLLARAGFRSNGIFVMDGSRRSSHGNAYFTGLGRNKRIVFFDTLLARLEPAQIEAVLAHELGHFKHRHIVKRIAFLFVLSLVLLAVLAWVKEAGWFYAGLGVASQTDATALALFFLVLPVFLFPATPVMSLYSRRHEFQADAFAARQTDPAHLVTALVRLYRDNAATLTPDPLYSLFYDSHPKAVERIEKLERFGQQSVTPQPA
ncbi:MAG: STE24 endopeptidase [bacterium]|nr:MAG: STE24 endopeptidase [bacterium]KAF0148063.1 MAG: STE24 endopeptidase [bacterium]KAF0167579.1 MAG: STE24 endopeptidase [bacterium]TXT17478.1 MAG: STE24 endopeptidase [bacterium]